MTSVMSSFAQGQHDALSKQGFEREMNVFIEEYSSNKDNILRVIKMIKL